MITFSAAATLIGYSLAAGLAVPGLLRRRERATAVVVGLITVLALALAVAESLMLDVPRISTVIGALFDRLLPGAIAKSFGFPHALIQEAEHEETA
ncbi:MAG: hypothetical protein ACM3XN_07765 [Chloroflexota bacterium]